MHSLPGAAQQLKVFCLHFFKLKTATQESNMAKTGTLGNSVEKMPYVQDALMKHVWFFTIRTSNETLQKVNIFG